MEEPDFWEDTEGSQKVMKELKMLKDTLKTAEELNQQYEDTGVLLEMAEEEQDEILEFFTQNKMLILLDIVKGRGKFAAEWILVAQKYENIFRWTLKPINVAINHYSEGEVLITSRGSLKLGRVTMQRKGGDAGRDTANMLQFKVDPTELFNIN